MKSVPPGVHAIPLGDGDGEQPIEFHTPDGQVTIGRGVVSPGLPEEYPESAGTVFVPCEGRMPGERVYHVLESGHRGPPRVNSTAYCKNYERIFHKQDRPSDDRPN